jgi:hypothetical protein
MFHFSQNVAKMNVESVASGAANIKGLTIFIKMLLPFFRLEVFFVGTHLRLDH